MPASSWAVFILVEFCLGPGQGRQAERDGERYTVWYCPKIETAARWAWDCFALLLVFGLGFGLVCNCTALHCSLWISPFGFGGSTSTCPLEGTRRSRKAKGMAVGSSWDSDENLRVRLWERQRGESHLPFSCLSLYSFILCWLDWTWTWTWTNQIANACNASPRDHGLGWVHS